MAKLVWDQTGERFYEVGVRMGVLFPQSDDGDYPLGVAWNGLTSVSENPSGGEPSPGYADDIKYLNMISLEEFAATIEAYTYPDEFALLDGSAEVSPGMLIGQQTRKTFGFCYRTSLGNDLDGLDHGYKLHLVYGGLARPSQKTYGTINENPDAIVFSWELSTTPTPVPGYRPTSTVVLDSTKIPAEKMAEIEDMLYGTEETEPHLPLPGEIIALLSAA